MIGMVEVQPARARASVSRLDAVVVGASVFVIIVLLLQLLDFGYGRDQGIFAVVGRAIREGGVPYRDAWDFKPPGIYFVYALAGSTVRGIRVLEAIALGSMTVAFALLSRRYVGDPRAGIVGAAIAILTHVRLEFWHTAQPESFGAVLVAWGLTAAALATDPGAASNERRARWLWCASGLSYGAAALLKPTIGIAAGASLLSGFVAFDRDRGARSVSARKAAGISATFLLCACLPVIACVLFFAMHGGLSDAREALGFIPQYTRLAWAHSTVLGLSGLALRRWLFEYSLYIPAGLALLLLARPGRRVWSGVLHVGLAVCLLLGGIVAQGKLFPYHFGTVLPLTALVAGWGFWRAWEFCREHSTRRLLLVGAVAILAVLQPRSPDLRDTFWTRCVLRWTAWTHADERLPIRDRLYSVADYNAADNRRTAEWIARATPRDAALLVWGFTPEIYMAAGRAAASRYIYDVPQRAPWSREQARQQLMSDLRGKPPGVIVVERGDVMPWVLGNASDSARDLASFVELRELLSSNYRLSISFGEFDIYSRAN
jgi:hypothetical protein